MIFKTHIVEQKIIADSTREVVLARPNGFSYQPGQYVQVAVAQLTHTDQKGSYRVFSLASDPRDRQHLSVLFRDTGSVFKKTLASLPVNTEVTIEGPSGHFVYPEESRFSHIYVAGGVGISPFLSMLAYNQGASFHTPVTLIYANRSKESAAYREKLQILASKNEWFELDEVYGRIDERILRTHASGDEGALWFVVGPPQMVSAVEYLLQKIGVGNNKIRIESFTGY